MAKAFRMCPRCHRKGLHKSTGYPYFGDGTETCRYCSFTLSLGKDEAEALAAQGGPRPWNGNFSPTMLKMLRILKEKGGSYQHSSVKQVRTFKALERRGAVTLTMKNSLGYAGGIRTCHDVYTATITGVGQKAAETVL